MIFLEKRKKISGAGKSFPDDLSKTRFGGVGKPLGVHNRHFFSIFDDFSPKNEKKSPGPEKTLPDDLSKTRSGGLGNRFFDPKT